MKRTNLQNIADHLDLARSTVSRALHNDPLIAAETRRRVKEAAEKLGYRSNPYLSVLMAKVREGASPTGSPVVAFLNPQSTRDGWRDSKPMVAAFQAAASRARELGFDLQEFWLGEHGMTPTRMAEILRSRGIRALILGAPGHARSLLPFETSGFAAVAVDLDPTRDQLHRATADYLGNTSKTLKALRALGYRRVGLAIDEETIARMLQFPRMAFLEFEETLPRSDRTGSSIGPLDDLAGFIRWLVDCKPDAIVTANVYRQWWLQSLGFRIPQDIGVAQLDPDFVPFPVSGIDGRFDVVGRNAIDLLISQINRHEFAPPTDPMHVMNDGVWRAGATTVDRNCRQHIDPFDELRLAICREAAAGNLETLALLRRQLCKRFYSTPFALAAEAAVDSWRPLALNPSANSRLHTPTLHPSFTDTRTFGLSPGRQSFRGVPFDLPPSITAGPDTVIVLNLEDESGKGRTPPVHRVAVDAKVRAIYLLQCALFVWNPVVAARYRLVYAGGGAHAVDVLPYWPPLIEAEAAGIHDSWRALPHFETASLKPIFVVSDQRPFVGDFFFYILEVRNPHPSRPVVAVELIANAESHAKIVVASITALLAP